jgi:hypothetical protein
MIPQMQDVCCARLAKAQLAALARARCAGDVQAVIEGDNLWLRWRAGDDDMLRLVLPLPGLTLFVQRDGRWYRLGSRLPVSVPPASAGQRVDQLLGPELVRPVEVAAQSLVPVRLRLVRDGTVRPPSGLETTLDVLVQWADTAPTAWFGRLRAAWSGRRAILLGERLPLLPGSTRYWGQRLLTPLGFRPDPAWPESALVDALALRDEDLILLKPTGGEIVPAAAFQLLTRAGVRLAGGERVP